MTSATPVTPTADAAISVRGLRKRFGDVLALDRLDLDVPAGSVFGLLGPNGAGKTTAIRILTALARPTAGRAELFGRDAAEVVRAGRVGYLPQEPRFYGWMRGRELLDLVGRLHGMAAHTRPGRVATALDAAGLAAAGDRRIGTYSGGMRQRLGIAQALLHEPDLLVLDEPVSSLDPAGRREVLEVIASLRGRTTTLLSTHVLADVERVCDRIAILDRGRLVIEGELSTLLAGRATATFRIEVEDGDADAVAGLVARLRDRPWARQVELATKTVITVSTGDPGAAGPAILRALLDGGLKVRSFSRVQPTLEDVFLELVARRARLRPTAEREVTLPWR